MNELQKKSLMFFFGFSLGAKIDEKFEITDKSVKTINKDGVEKEIPLEIIPFDSEGNFIFTAKTFKTDSPMAIVVLNDDFFVFSTTATMKFIKENSRLVEHVKDEPYWYIKQEYLDSNAFYTLKMILK